MSGSENLRALADFLGRRLDEVESQAREAAEGAGGASWAVGETLPCECCCALRVQVSGGDPGGVLCKPDSRYVDFMADHDPQWVLDDIEIKRETLAEWTKLICDADQADAAGRLDVRMVYELLRQHLTYWAFRTAKLWKHHPDYHAEWSSKSTEKSEGAELCE